MGVLLAWAIAAGIQTTRDVRYLGRAPVPSEYVASGMLFGSLSILSSFAESLATALAWGFLFAMTVEAGGPHQLVTGGFPEPLAKYFSPGSPAVTPVLGRGEKLAPNRPVAQPGTTPHATGGTSPAIRQIQRAARRKYPWIVSLGVCSCRHIQGSSEWSQHAWCNAWDIAAVGPVGDMLARWFVSQAGTLPIAQVIWKGQEQLHGGSVYDHYTHIHISGDPMRSGTPPCAGG